jgi:hypothetical protein
MRGLLSLLGCRLGGADVHVTVDLAAVGVDYLSTEALGQNNGQPGLTYSGGADDSYQTGQSALSS